MGGTVLKDNSSAFNTNRLTRLKQNGFYYYTFRNTEGTNPVLYLQDSVPIVEFISDTLLDINGDNITDVLIMAQYRNGHCTPKYAIAFCFDTIQHAFIKIPAVSNIPNPEFFPTKKKITGVMECKMRRDRYDFRWNGFRIDTVNISSAATSNIN